MKWCRWGYVSFYILWLQLSSQPSPTRSELEERIVEQDLYGILNVTASASTAEIKKSFRKLAQRYHPDKAGADRAKESEERFRSIADAYEVLSNDRDRREYDQRRLLQYSNSRHDGMEDSMYHHHREGMEKSHYANDHDSMRDMYLELLMQHHHHHHQFMPDHDHHFFRPRLSLSIIGPVLASGQVMFPLSSLMVSSDGSYFALLDRSCSFKIYRGDADDYISYLTYVLNRDGHGPYRYHTADEEDRDEPVVMVVFETQPTGMMMMGGRCFAGLDDLGVFHVFSGHPSDPNSYPLWSSIDSHSHSSYHSRDDFMHRASHKEFVAMLLDGALVIYSESRLSPHTHSHSQGGPEVVVQCEWSSAGSCSELLSTARHVGLEISYQFYTRSRPLRDSLAHATSSLSQMLRRLFSHIESVIAQVYLRLLQILTR